MLMYASSATKESIRKMLNLIDEVVDEFGQDYVYTPDVPTDPYVCQYIHVSGEVPKVGCLGGQVLHRMGVSMTHLQHGEGHGVGWFVGAVPGLSTEATEVLRAAQIQQDSGRSWGEARARAHAYASTQYGLEF